jgi:hypothetical protein
MHRGASGGAGSLGAWIRWNPEVWCSIWTWAVVHIHRTRIVQRAINILIAAWGGLRAGSAPA